MVSLIGMDEEQIKKAFVLFAEDCKKFTQIIKNEKDKSNETGYTPEIISTSLSIFERIKRFGDRGRVKPLFSFFSHSTKISSLEDVLYPLLFVNKRATIAKWRKEFCLPERETERGCFFDLMSQKLKTTKVETGAYDLMTIYPIPHKAEKECVLNLVSCKEELSMNTFQEYVSAISNNQLIGRELNDY